MRKPASWGRSRSWTFCLITVLFSCCVFGFSDIQRRVFIEENPADMKTVRYCFVTFYLNSRFSSIPFSREATSELSVQHKVLFLCVFFFFSQQGEGSNKHNDVQKNANASVKHLHHSPSLFKQLSSLFIPLRKDTVSSRLGRQGGKKKYKTQSCRMDWSCDETQMCHSHVKIKSTHKSHSSQ